MHSLNQIQLARTIARERALPSRRFVHRPPPPPGRERPPLRPLRGSAAYMTGRLAARLDRDTARRAVI